MSRNQVLQSVLNRERTGTVSQETLVAEPVEIRWDPSLPVFAKEEFLEAVGDEYGWLGGIDASGTLRCFLPYTILRKAGLRLVRFRTATVPFGAALGLLEERVFLNSVVQYFRRTRVDVIIPPSNNAIFRTCPDGAQAAPYGTYVIDLSQPEDVLWKNIDRITRQNINTARKGGVSILEGLDSLRPAYDLIRDTFRRSNIPFMDWRSFNRVVFGLGIHGKLLKAECRGLAQSYCLFGFSDHRAYAIYAGNVPQQEQGSNKFIYWEAIRLFRSLGVRQFDFFGARIKPEKGSKQESINQLKRHLGATLTEGYMWKYPLRPWRALPYSVGVRMLRGGDIVDQEEKRLGGCRPTIAADAPFTRTG